MAIPAIIGGSGLEQLGELEIERELAAATPYGQASAPVQRGRLAGAEVLFLSRHGHAHALAPDAVNYRANLWALQAAGAGSIFAVYTVGGIAETTPGALVVPDQVIDYTWGRAHSFSEPGRVLHVDCTEPFDAALRRRLIEGAHTIAGDAVPVVERGVYACTQGPRLETAAEIDRLERDGCAVVGMTGMPEIALARELELPLAGICLVVNAAAGRGAIDLEAMQGIIAAGRGRVLRILARAIRSR